MSAQGPLQCDSQRLAARTSAIACLQGTWQRVHHLYVCLRLHASPRHHEGLTILVPLPAKEKREAWEGTGSGEKQDGRSDQHLTSLFPTCCDVPSIISSSNRESQKRGLSIRQEHTRSHYHPPTHHQPLPENLTYSGAWLHVPLQGHLPAVFSTGFAPRVLRDPGALPTRRLCLPTLSTLHLSTQGALLPPRK